MTLEILTCSVQAEDWWTAKAVSCVVLAGCTEPERTGETVQFLSLPTAQRHIPPSSHFPCEEERVCLAFCLMPDLHLSLVSLSPQEKWGIIEVNGACRTAVLDPDSCGHELRNCSSFLTLCSVLQQIFCWAGWQTSLNGEPWRGLWHEALCVVKDGWHRNIQSACSYNLDRLVNIGPEKINVSGDVWLKVKGKQIWAAEELSW